MNDVIDGWSNKAVGGSIHEEFSKYIYIYIWVSAHWELQQTLDSKKMMMKIQGYQQADISTKIEEEDNRQKPTWIC